MKEQKEEPTLHVKASAILNRDDRIAALTAERDRYQAMNCILLDGEHEVSLANEVNKLQIKSHELTAEVERLKKENREAHEYWEIADDKMQSAIKERDALRQQVERLKEREQAFREFLECMDDPNGMILQLLSTYPKPEKP